MQKSVCVHLEFPGYVDMNFKEGSVHWFVFFFFNELQKQ